MKMRKEQDDPENKHILLTSIIQSALQTAWQHVSNKDKIPVDNKWIPIHKENIHLTVPVVGQGITSEVHKTMPTPLGATVPAYHPEPSVPSLVREVGGVGKVKTAAATWDDAPPRLPLSTPTRTDVSPPEGIVQEAVRHLQPLPGLAVPVPGTEFGAGSVAPTTPKDRPRSMPVKGPPPAVSKEAPPQASSSRYTKRYKLSTPYPATKAAPSDLIPTIDLTGPPSVPATRWERRTGNNPGASGIPLMSPPPRAKSKVIEMRGTVGVATCEQQCEGASDVAAGAEFGASYLAGAEFGAGSEVAGIT